MRKNFKDLLFVFLTFSGLTFLSLYIFIKNPKEISNEENRYLASFKYLELTSFFDGSFQNQIENAYTDQFPKRNLIVNFKNRIDDYTRNLLLRNISELTLVKLSTETGDIFRLGISDRMINVIIEDTEENRQRMQTRAIEINELQKRHPDTKIYVYSPTQVHETDLFDSENNIKAGANALWKIFEENIDVPFKKFDLNSIDLYKKMYFKSDHHPNYIGSDIFYNEIIAMLKPNETPLKPTLKNCEIGKNFYGTFANRTGRITPPEEFCIYDYDIKDYTVYINGEIAKDYTYRKDFFNFNNPENEAYPYYYNEAYKIYDPIMMLDTKQTNLENILIIGDSFSNSILDLIASHYNKTYRVAPYQTIIKEGYLFDYDKFITENEIDVVLFMYTMENYYYKDKWGDRYEQNRILENGGK